MYFIKFIHVNFSVKQYICKKNTVCLKLKKKTQLNDTVQAIEKKLLYRKNKYHTKNMHCQMNFGQ